MEKLKLLKNKKILRVVGALLVLAVVAMIFIKPEANAEEDVLWREYKVERGDITASLDGSGKLEAAGISHGFDFPLKIEQILFKEGDWVNEGEVLVRYDKEELYKKIKDLEYELSAATRNLEDARNNKIKSELQGGLTDKGEEQGRQGAYEKQKRETQNTIEGLEYKIEKLKGKIDTLEESLEKAEKSKDGSSDSEELRKLKEELRRLQKKLRGLENDSADNSNAGQISALEQQRAGLRSQIREMEKQMEEFKDDEEKLAELRAKINDLEREISSIDKQIYALEKGASDGAAIKKIQNQIAELQGEIDGLSSKEEKITGLREQLDQAKDELKTAEFDRETQRIALDNLKKDYEGKNAQEQERKSSQSQIDEITLAGLDNAIENAQDQVEKARANLAEAGKLLNAPVLTAKGDGVVTKINYTEGDDVPAGKSVLTIGDSGEKRVVIQISQEDIGRVNIDQIVEMQFVASPDETLKGKVADKSLAPTEGGDGVTYRVEIAFDEEQEELLQGMTCGAKFILKRVENVLTLSNKAISLKDGKQYVTVLLPDGSHEEREIKTGFSDGRTSEVTSGLSEGDTVVVEG